MKRLLLASVALFLATLGSPAAEKGHWQTDLEAAKAEAKKDNKLILMDFTGSDWCGWCVKMKKESLDQKEFLDYAAKQLVLVEVDFPQKKAQTAAVKKANKALQDKYGVEGFPTYVVTDAQGKELGRHVGYLKGGPTAFISLVDGFKKKSP